MRGLKDDVRGLPPQVSSNESGAVRGVHTGVGLPSLVDRDSQPYSEPEAPVLGRVLAGRYQLRRAIADGGMATVYAATDRTSNTEVAVKVMHPELTRERGFALRFKREAVIAARLDHPGVVRVLDHGTDGNLFFLVMELLDGADIFDVLARRKRIEADVARRVVIDVCEALAAAHAVGIVHRDLKPENVFLRRAGAFVEVRVLDFGVAKMVLPEERSDDVDTALTAIGTLLGTPEYLSPEMCLGDPVGPPADIYACGVLLYALLTGRPPFVTERPIDVTLMHISDEPLPPSWFLPGLDPAIDAIVLKALAKRPDQRHASARALADALLAVGPTERLSASLLEGGEGQKHSPNAPTLSVPNALPRLADLRAREDAEHDDASATLQVANPPAREGAEPEPEVGARFTAGPATVRKGPATEQSTTRIALAAIVLAATFAAGFFAGRASTSSASSAPASPNAVNAVNASAPTPR